jgi:hypothetical protein
LGSRKKENREVIVVTIVAIVSEEVYTADSERFVRAGKINLSTLPMRKDVRPLT